jgi:hypothetical protein
LALFNPSRRSESETLLKGSWVATLSSVGADNILAYIY